MKAKQLLSIGLAAVMAAASVAAVSAAQLTESNPSGQTEVTARITGNAGDVTYIITIPDVVDFGELQIPADNAEDYNKDVTFTVEATEITGLDPDAQKISVFVKDQNATQDDDQEFHIANKDNANIVFDYDMYSATENLSAANCVNGGNMRTHGYYLTSFTAQGESMTGTLRFAQRQLYGQSIADIAGEYSGYMVFFSAIEPKNA